MNSNLRKGWWRLLMSVLLAVAPVPLLAAELLRLSLVEYGYPGGRTGTLRVSTPAAGLISPFAANPTLAPYNTNLWVEVDWGSVGSCGGSHLAGGHLEGWLLGPDTSPGNLGVVPGSAALYGVTAGLFGDTGYATRAPCSGTVRENYAILYVYLYPREQQRYESDAGYLVGNAFYVTDYGAAGNGYRVYSGNSL